MKVLITGANGMVARACRLHCYELGDEIIALTHSELDIGDMAAVDDAVRQVRPDAIINCAAFTDVDGAESQPVDAYRANAAGPLSLATASRASGARFVTISTDYVFNGKKEGFYTQLDTPDPQSVYASTKYEGEALAVEANPRSIIVRSGWIYGRGGTNFLSVIHRLLAEGKTIKAIGDSYGTPTFADDLARRLRELVVLDLPGIYHATNSGPGTSYRGFAEKLCEIGGFEKSLLESVANDDLKRPAARPCNSRLRCLISEKRGLPAMPDWESALRVFAG